MIIWRGWGIVVVGIVAVCMMVFAGLGSQLLPKSALPYSIAFGLLVAAAGTWFAGNALNKTAPQKKIDAWAAEREQQLRQLVDSGQFSLGPGQPQPQSHAEAQQMATALLAAEKEQLRGAFNQHTLFWIPVQYFAFILPGIAVLVLIAGVISNLR